MKYIIYNSEHFPKETTWNTISLVGDFKKYSFKDEDGVHYSWTTWYPTTITKETILETEYIEESIPCILDLNENDIDGSIERFKKLLLLK